MVRALFLALVALFSRGPHAACIAGHAETTVRRAESAETNYGVPAGVLLTVGFLETHLGCANGSGGNWGAPVDRAHRHTAGTSDSAARSLQTGFRRCGTWQGALGWFRCGHCRCPRMQGYDPDFAGRLVERVYRRAQVAVPEHLR